MLKNVDSQSCTDTPPSGYCLFSDLCLPLYCDHYCRDHPTMFCQPQSFSQVKTEHLQQMQYPNFLLKEPPDIHQWLYSFLKKQDFQQFPFLPGVSLRTLNVIAVSPDVEFKACVQLGASLVSCCSI